MHVEHPWDLSRFNRVAAYYLLAVSFYAVIWTARLSILFAIIRIDPDSVVRQRLKWLAVVFIGAFGFLVVQLLWICNEDPSWRGTPSPQCRLPKQVPICQLVSMYPFTHTSFFPSLRSLVSYTQRTYFPTCCSFYYLFGSFEASRIRISAGVLDSYSPHLVAPRSLLYSLKL
jgi:hypothetical protein